MLNFLRPAEVQQCHDDLAACDEQIRQINMGFDPRANQNDVYKTKASIMERLQQEPPDLNPEQRSRVAKRITQLEEDIKVGMLSSEEMRRNPSDAVFRNTLWQKQNGKKIVELKNLQLALHKGASQEEMDVRLNIERLRPGSSMLGMHDARIDSKTYVRGFGDAIDWDWGKNKEPEKTAVELLDEAVEADAE